MMPLKKLSLFGLLIAASSSLFGMDSKGPRSFFSKSRKSSTAPAAKEDTSAKLQASFDTLMKDLYAIAEKINDSNKKNEAKRLLGQKCITYSTTIPLSSKLENINQVLQQEIGNEQQVKVVMDTLKEKFGPSALQASMIEDIKGKGYSSDSFYNILINTDQSDLARQADDAIATFSQKDTGTIYGNKSLFTKEKMGKQ